MIHGLLCRGLYCYRQYMDYIKIQQRMYNENRAIVLKSVIYIETFAGLEII